LVLLECILCIPWTETCRFLSLSDFLPDCAQQWRLVGWALRQLIR
jgi:hypothetical protein